VERVQEENRGEWLRTQVNLKTDHYSRDD